MSAPILAFAGPMASGKTTISRAVAETLGWPWAGFGAYIRAEAQRRGLQGDRTSLQQLGDALLAEGEEAFCKGVLAEAGWVSGTPLVLDGVRHATVVNALHVLITPQPLVLVYVAITDDVRAARLGARGVDADAQQLHDAHATESDVTTILPKLADLTVDGSWPLGTIIAHLTKAFQSGSDTVCV